MSEGMSVRKQLHLQQTHDLGRDKLRQMTNEIIRQDKELTALREEHRRLRLALESADFALAVYEPDSKDTIRIARERIAAALQPVTPTRDGGEG